MPRDAGVVGLAVPRLKCKQKKDVFEVRACNQSMLRASASIGFSVASAKDPPFRDHLHALRTVRASPLTVL